MFPCVRINDVDDDDVILKKVVRLYSSCGCVLLQEEVSELSGPKDQVEC